MGKSIRNAKKPSGAKLMFASKISPTNHADNVAMTALKYTALFPFSLNVKDIINIRNTKNSRIAKTNPSNSVPSKARFIFHLLYHILLFVSILGEFDGVGTHQSKGKMGAIFCANGNIYAFCI